MPKYRVTMMEKIFYEIHIEADNEEEAEEIAENSLGDADVTNCYIDDIYVEEESE